MILNTSQRQRNFLCGQLKRELWGRGEVKVEGKHNFLCLVKRVCILTFQNPLKLDNKKKNLFLVYIALSSTTKQT